MRLSRLLIAVAAAFSASAFAVGPPGSPGPRQDDDTQLPQAWTNSPSTEDRGEQGTTASAEGSQPGASVSERDENASLTLVRTMPGNPAPRANPTDRRSPIRPQ